MPEPEPQNDAENLKTIQGLREENKWLKALVDLYAARIGVMEEAMRELGKGVVPNQPPTPQ